MRSGKILFSLLLMLITLPVIAQRERTSNVEVKGTVIEEGNKEPVEQATVRLLNLSDSTFIGGIASGRNGSFSLKNIKPGKYLLHISYVGFDPLYQPLEITGRRNPVDVGKLELTDGTIRLGEAVVIGKAAEIVVKNDTIEYNADSYKVTEGSVLEDLLKKMPGVEVDSEGKITVNGKEISKILVDGKEFFSDDPKTASKNLPADMIEKIQTYEKRSDMSLMTGFDDGEEENVINLTIKPGMKQGWFGNAFAGYGSEERYEGNAMVNRFINNDQITIMGGINNTNNMGFSDLASTMFSGMGGGGRRGPGGGGGGGFGGAGNGITQSGSLGLNFNKEFKPNLTLNGNLRYSHSDNDARGKSHQQNILNKDSITYEDEISKSNSISNNFGANFRLEWKPDSMTTIIFRPDFSFSKNESRSDGDVLSYDALGNIYSSIDSSYSKGNGYNLNAQFEYSRKLNNKGRVFSFSVSGGISDRDNEGDNYSRTDYYRKTNGEDLELVDQEFKYENNGYNYRAYLSWVEPIGRNNFIQATYSFRQNKQEALKNTYTIDDIGFYTILDSAYSQSYDNNFITQRASLSFRSQREKFNYTLGINVDPSYNSSKTFVGDSVLSRISRSVVNVSPMAQFNYLWDKRTNLRVSYNGRTTQPSVTQLQPVPEITSTTNIRIGNPDLKPTYTNNLFIRFQKFIPEKQRAFMVFANMNYVINDIVNKIDYTADNSGNRVTTYENVNGNYSGNVRVMMNTPFRNTKFSFNTMTMASYSHKNGFSGTEKNTSKQTRLMERLGLDFRSDFLDLGINGNINYLNANNTLQAANDQNTIDYGVGGSTTIYLPLNIKIESDINYTANSGYSDGYDQEYTIWNAGISKSFLKNNQATLRFKYYDMLQQRSSVTRTITANYITDTEYNTLSSYFMIHFIYRFSIFSGGGSMNDVGPRGGRGPGGPGGPPPRF